MGGLVIVESPNKCAKLRKILGDDYEVVSSVGHIMDLEKKNMGVEIETWTPLYKINDDKQDVVKNLKNAAKKHKNVYVASDNDSEGHAISFHIKSLFEDEKKNIYRVIFKTITKPDVLNGIQNPIPFDENAYNSQKTRRISDRLIGFKVSPQMWAKGLRSTSAGRVQSTCLKFLVDREREIKKFIQEEYWSITAKTKLNFDAEFYGTNGKKYIPNNKEKTQDIINDIKGDLTISDYQKKIRNRETSPPFITSTLQKEVGTKFGWSSQKVMDLAQSLFAAGLCTYIRTDSVSTEPGKLQELRDMIEQQHGKKYLSPKAIIYSSKDNSQGAHECIRPTYEPEPVTLSQDEKRLLDLIKAKFMASQMAPAQFDQVTVKLEVQGQTNKYEFRTTGSIQTFDGFLKVYGSTSKDVLLPSLTKGQKVGIDKLIPQQHFTKPPSRYSEPLFVEKMETEGIGRPSTYGATIEKLINHKYIVRDNKVLVPTEIGEMVCMYLEKHFINITSPNLTAKMEGEMDLIAEGKLEMISLLNSFYEDLIKTLKTAQNDKSKDLFKSDIPCDKCNDGSVMVKKISEYGVFYGCENHPKCGHILTLNKEGSLVANQTETGHPCPDCGGIVVERKSKFGKFLSCKSYPTCNWKGKLDSDGKIAEKKKVEDTGISCSQCKKGTLLKRQYKDKFFLGCSNYPKCKHTMNLDESGNPIPKAPSTKSKSKAKSTGKVCPKCKTNDLVERINATTQESFIACSGFPKCKYIQKDKK